VSRLSPLQGNARRSLGDQIYESIREAIVSLRMEPGTLVYENELAETLGVSRTPIRDAIRLLVSEQLLEVLPQRGTRIAFISERKVSEARFIREHLELGAFRLVARQWNQQDRTREVEAIRKLFLEQRMAADREDIAAFLQLDEAFHRTVMEMTGNETLLQVIGHMRAHLNRLRFLAIREYRTMGRVMEEHEQLLTALQEGDEPKTAMLLEQHIGKLDHELPELRRAHAAFFKD
jgi:GntR family transcriptional regulator, rspAB operon transcriptional repressor